jgi:RNA polymerase sigma-70 factor (ECF subfamily)
MIPSPTNEELMLSLSRGDFQALEIIVSRFQKKIWNIAFRFLGNEEEAQDITQEIFLKIFEAAPQYRVTASFQSYLFRIVTNLCLDHIRKKQPVYLENFPDIESENPSPIETILHQEQSTAVFRAIAQLPPGQRLTVVLKYFENLKYSEIADAMNISEKAVERLLARGRASLEKMLSIFFEN